MKTVCLIKEAEEGRESMHRVNNTNKSNARKHVNIHRTGIQYNNTNVKKGKAVTLQAWSGPDGSRKLRFRDFMTTAQDGGKVVSLMHRPPLPPGNTPGTHFC